MKIFKTVRFCTDYTITKYDITSNIWIAQNSVMLGELDYICYAFQQLTHMKHNIDTSCRLKWVITSILYTSNRHRYQFINIIQENKKYCKPTTSGLVKRGRSFREIILIFFNWIFIYLKHLIIWKLSFYFRNIQDCPLYSKVIVSYYLETVYQILCFI